MFWTATLVCQGWNDAASILSLTNICHGADGALTHVLILVESGSDQEEDGARGTSVLEGQ